MIERQPIYAALAVIFLASSVNLQANVFARMAQKAGILKARFVNFVAPIKYEVKPNSIEVVESRNYKRIGVLFAGLGIHAHIQKKNMDLHDGLIKDQGSFLISRLKEVQTRVQPPQAYWDERHPRRVLNDVHGSLVEYQEKLKAREEVLKRCWRLRITDSARSRLSGPQTPRLLGCEKAFVNAPLQKQLQLMTEEVRATTKPGIQTLEAMLSNLNVPEEYKWGRSNKS
jgi:hypothetical protein